MKKSTLVIILLMGLVLLAVLTGCSAEPQLVIDNAYKHQGSYSGNSTYNTYTFTIKNDSRTDIDSVDYFRIYFYDGRNNEVGVWHANSQELKSLALDAGDAQTFRINVPERDLPYNGDWGYDTEYSIHYYD